MIKELHKAVMLRSKTQNEYKKKRLSKENSLSYTKAKK